MAGSHQEPKSIQQAEMAAVIPTTLWFIANPRIVSAGFYGKRLPFCL